MIESRGSASPESAIYLCGNSLGVQPKLVSARIQQYLSTWATQGVFGHFKPLAESPLPVWLDADNSAAKHIAPIVGGQLSEVAVMETLTANLHLLMCAFYKPDIHGRHKILLESKAFPSDHVGTSFSPHLKSITGRITSTENVQGRNDVLQLVTVMMKLDSFSPLSEKLISALQLTNRSSSSSPKSVTTSSNPIPQ